MLRPTWERYEFCRAQLYLRGDLPPGHAGFLVPRRAPEQWACPDAPPGPHPDGVVRGHEIDVFWARRFRGPRCDGVLFIDGPDRPAIECPRRPAHRVTWTTSVAANTGAAVGRRCYTWSRQGCARHFPALVDAADHAVARQRDPRWGDPGWPAPVIADVELVLTPRDRAHGRPGAWTLTDTDQPTQLQLF